KIGLSKWIHSAYAHGPNAIAVPAVTASPNHNASAKRARKAGHVYGPRTSSAPHRPTANVAVVSLAPDARPTVTPATNSVRIGIGPVSARFSSRAINQS